MKKTVISAMLLSLITFGANAQKEKQAHGYPIDPVPFTSVKVTDSFWGQRLKASREVTILWHSANVKKQGATKTLKWQHIRVKTTK